MGWPRGAEAVLAKLDHHRRSRAELIVLAKIEDADWPPAIAFLVGSGFAVRTGSQRGARYQRATETGRRLHNGGEAYADNLVAVGFHDLIDELLRQLDGDTSNQGCDEWEDEGDEGDGGSPEFDDDESTDGEGGIEARLRARGVVQIIDHRMRGGCLWVLDGPGVTAAIEAVSRELGVRFFYKAEGGRSTDGAAAWWTRGT